MTRRTRSLAAALPLAALLLAGCGSQDASQGSVRDAVRDSLSDNPNVDLEGEELVSASECVAEGMFQGDFTKDERNEATRASDADQPSQALVDKVNALFVQCEIDLSPVPG